MEGTGGMELRHRGPDAREQIRVRVARGQPGSQGLGADDPPRDEIGAVVQAAAHIARRHWRGHRQAAPQQLLQQAELGETARALGAGPEVAVAEDARHQTAATVVAQHAGPQGARRNQASPRPASARSARPRSRQAAASNHAPSACAAQAGSNRIAPSAVAWSRAGCIGWAAPAAAAAIVETVISAQSNNPA